MQSQMQYLVRMMAQAQSERDHHILSILLQHPYLHDGLTAESGYHYLLGRTHRDRRNEQWRKSPRTFAYWLKRSGFSAIRMGDVNRYFWPEAEE